MGTLYVISAVAKDQPGLVHSIAKILADLKINIVDIEARAVRGHFSMFLVVDLSTSDSSYEEMMRTLTPIGNKFEMGLRVEAYEAGRRKAEKRLMLLTVMGIDRPGIVAVGDGANDRFMLANAGLAIAFSPKEILKKYSDGMITTDNISGLLYFLGIPDSQLQSIKKTESEDHSPSNP